MKVLFVNHKQQQCGVYQFGKRIYELSRNSQNIHYDYIEVERLSDFEERINQFQPDCILYNWYPVTMSWLGENWVQSHKNYKHYFIFHDGNVRQNYDLYLFSGSEGKDISFKKSIILPRPLFSYREEYPDNELMTVGSFGFGGWQKGFTRLVEIVNSQFDKAIINIQMPFAFFGDRYGNETRKVADACRNLNTNPGVTLNIDHKFLSNDSTLRFLAKNDINVFLYKSSNQGLSSVIDYALSVKRPIAITNDSMFKHIYKPELDIDNFSLLEIKERGTAPLQEYYDKWNPDKFCGEMDKVYDS